MSTWTVRFHIRGHSIFGDLTLSDFATQRTANEVALVVARALRAEYPEATVITEAEKIKRGGR